MKGRINSFKVAFKGILLFIQTETNAKIHLSFTFLVFAAGLFFQISYTEWCLLILAIAIVLAAEAMNTAIETLTDLVSPDYNKLAGKTKDVAAGAVLLTAIGAATVGGIVFFPKIWFYFFS